MMKSEVIATGTVCSCCVLTNANGECGCEIQCVNEGISPTDFVLNVLDYEPHFGVSCISCGTTLAGDRFDSELVQFTNA